MSTLPTLRTSLRTLGIATLLAGAVLGGGFLLEKALGTQQAEACWSWRGCGEEVPYCTLKATSNSILQGESTTLTWSTGGGVDSVEFFGFPAASYPGTGSLSVQPTESHTYRIVAKSSTRNSVAECEVSISVGEACLPGTCSMKVAPSSITKGEEATLSWETTNVESASIDNGVGTVARSGSTKVKPNTTTTYTGTFKDTSGKTLTCTATLNVTPVHVPDPWCTVGASPTTIIRGQSTTLWWTSANVTGAVFDQGIGSVTGSSTKLVSPDKTTTYTGTFSGANGKNITCATTVTVTEPAHDPWCSMGVEHTSIVRGQQTTLYWSSFAVKSASIDQGIGVVGVSNHLLVKPTVTTTYTGTFLGNNGETTVCRATVTVTEPEVPTPSCTLTAGSASIVRGATTTLSWRATNIVGQGTLTGFGAVGAEGAVSIAPATTTTYTAAFTGSNHAPISCSRTVTVTEPTPDRPVCTISINPTSVVRGSGATLTWTSSYATSGTIVGVGSVGVGGTATVTPQTTTTYAGTFQGPGGTAQCSATLTVVPPSSEPLPVCSMSVSPSTVNSGGSALLSWSSTNATAVSINQGIGTVATSGSSTVSASEAKTFVGTFTRGTSTVTCSATLSLSGGGGKCLNCGGSKKRKKEEEKKPSPTIVLAKKLTAGNIITLDQVPYTGFTAGPFVTVLFWLAVVGASALIAYLLTVFSAWARLRRAVVVRSNTYTAAEDIVRGDEMTYAVAEEHGASRVVPFSSVQPQVPGRDSVSQGMGFVEEMAHRDHILLSPEALRALEVELERTGSAPAAFLTKVFEGAKARYSREDGWILLSKERMAELFGAAPVEQMPAAAHVLAHDSPLHDVTFRNMRTLPSRSETVTPPSINGVAGRTASPGRQSAFDERDQVGVPPARIERVAQGPLTLVQALVAGDEAGVFSYVRERAQEGTLTASILEAIHALDDVYKNRLEGNHNPNQVLVQLTASWTNADFERVLGSLVECVDHSYVNGKVGVKIALTRALSHFKATR